MKSKVQEDTWIFGENLASRAIMPYKRTLALEILQGQNYINEDHVYIYK